VQQHATALDRKAPGRQNRLAFGARPQTLGHAIDNRYVISYSLKARAGHFAATGDSAVSVPVFRLFLEIPQQPLDIFELELRAEVPPKRRRNSSLSG